MPHLSQYWTLYHDPASKKSSSSIPTGVDGFSKCKTRSKAPRKHVRSSRKERERQRKVKQKLSKGLEHDRYKKSKYKYTPDGIITLAKPLENDRNGHGAIDILYNLLFELDGNNMSPEDVIAFVLSEAGKEVLPEECKNFSADLRDDLVNFSRDISSDSSSKNVSVID